MVSDISIKTKTAAYLLLKKEIEERKEQQEKLKTELMPYLLDAETNPRGSHVIVFDDPLEVHGTRYASLQRVRKESKVLIEERVIQWATENLTQYDTDRLIRTVQHVDQDVLWDLFVNEKLTEEELDSFSDVAVTWAFLPTKE